ncbi:MAG: cytochrome c [Ignavibacteria bacterium]|jgi:mono/diheme cytochrome c family protein|nr:cytochrome c [Ignavibacteria bacterium]
MNKFFKFFIYFFALVIIILTAGYFYIKTQYPKVSAAPDMKIVPSEEMVARGKYLAYGFASCMDCHSARDYSKMNGPIIAGTEGKGGQDYGEGAGFIPARNITSDVATGLGGWTDGEIFRAITMGVDKDGEPLGPMMPYTFYRNMDEDDIKAIIAYIRTLPPVKNKIPKHEFNFPVNLIFRTIPGDPDFKNFPDPDNKLAIGEYYSIGCNACHSPMEKGEFIKEKMFSGGVEFPAPKGGIVRTSNITPDPETGIGKWTKEQFIQKFRSSASPEVTNISVNEGEFNSVMPWTFYGEVCTDEDLGAVFDYLMSQKPISNKVEKFSPSDKYSGK